MTAPRRIPFAALLALVLGFLLLRAFLFAVTTAGEYALYSDYALAARNSSLAELHRARDIEYPPLATLFGVAVLHVADALPEGVERFTRWRPNPSRGTELARYEVALGLVLFAVDAACLLLIYGIARRIYPDDGSLARLGRLVVYVAATSAIGLILYDRQDLVVGFVAILALAAFVRGWPTAAYAVLTVGTAYKLVPVLLVPLFVLAAAAARLAPGTTGAFLRAVVRESLVAGLFLALVPIFTYLACGGERGFVFLTFHSTRGLQLEATPAWLVTLVDPATTVGHSFGSFNLRGALADRVARASTIATLIALTLCTLLVGRGFWRMSRQQPNRNVLATHLAAGSLLIWLAFIVFNKVGSPQYLLWLAPLLPLLPLRGADRYWTVLVLLGMVATTLVFPGQYLEIRGPETDDPGIWLGPTTTGLPLLAAKSLLLATSFVWLAAIVRRAPWISTDAALAENEHAR